MKIEIDAERVYKALTTPALSPQDQFFLEAAKQLKDGEDWRGGKAASVNMPSLMMFYGQSTALPIPFNNATPTFYRDSDFYSGMIYSPIQGSYTTLDKMNSLKGQIPEKMKQLFKEQWVPLDSLGRGVILFKGEPFIVLAEDGLSIGRNGAIKRKLGSLEDFASDIINLQKVTEAYVNSAIDIAVKQGFLPANPDYTATIGV